MVPHSGTLSRGEADRQGRRRPVPVPGRRGSRRRDGSRPPPRHAEVERRPDRRSPRPAGVPAAGGAVGEVHPLQRLLLVHLRPFRAQPPDPAGGPRDGKDLPRPPGNGPPERRGRPRAGLRPRPRIPAAAESRDARRAAVPAVLRGVVQGDPRVFRRRDGGAGLRPPLPEVHREHDHGEEGDAGGDPPDPGARVRRQPRRTGRGDHLGQRAGVPSPAGNSRPVSRCPFRRRGTRNP